MTFKTEESAERAIAEVNYIYCHLYVSYLISIMFVTIDSAVCKAMRNYHTLLFFHFRLMEAWSQEYN